MYRLNQNGYLDSEQVKVGERRTRVYYYITDSGRQYLQELLTEYKLISGAIEELLSYTESENQRFLGRAFFEKYSSEEIYRQVKRLYRGKRRFKRQFIQELKDALLCYLEEHPEATYTDLTKEFGHPSEIRDQLSFHTADELHLRNMTLYWTVVGLCSVAVITVVFFTVRHVVFMHDYS